MATYQILYWHEVPSQIKVEDDQDEVNVALPPKFQERIDELAAERGLADTDDYLAGWQWGEAQERDGHSPTSRRPAIGRARSHRGMVR